MSIRRILILLPILCAGTACIDSFDPTKGSGAASDDASDSAIETPILPGINICDETVPTENHVDCIPAYDQCDESLEAPIWTDNGLNTSTESQGEGWVLTQGYGGYQCTEYVSRYLRFARGVTQTPSGNAIAWCEGVPSQLDKTDIPEHGDIVVFHPGACGADTTYGHVAVVDVVDAEAETYQAVNQNIAFRSQCAFSDANCFLRPAD